MQETQRDVGSMPRSGRSPGGGHGTPVFLPGESQGQRSLSGYRLWGRSDATEPTHSNVNEAPEGQ